MLKNIFKIKLNNNVNALLKNSDRLRLSRMPRFEKTVLKFGSFEIMISDAPTFLSSFIEIFEQEIYKFTTKEAIPVIIDCGANIGLATLYFKTNYPTAKVLAFEPDPNIFAALKNNIEVHNFEGVELYNEAVGNTQETLLFNLEGGHSGMLVKEATNNTVSVSVTSLRNVLAKFERVDFLKMDIEGHEINVLPTIALELKKVRNLFLEYHTFIDQPQQLSEIIRLIEEAGFRYYIKEAAHKKNPFLERELFYKMDMLVNIFCYR